MPVKSYTESVDSFPAALKEVYRIVQQSGNIYAAVSSNDQRHKFGTQQQCKDWCELNGLQYTLE